MTKKIRVTAEVEIPSVPHILSLADGCGDLPLYALGNEELRAIGAEWTRNLLARAAEMRAGFDRMALHPDPAAPQDREGENDG